MRLSKYQIGSKTALDNSCYLGSIDKVASVNRAARIDIYDRPTSASIDCLADNLNLLLKCLEFLLHSLLVRLVIVHSLTAGQSPGLVLHPKKSFS